MANLENLNFAVILDDKQFNQQMAKVQAAAEAFNTTMSNALAISGVKGGTENIKKLVEQLREATKAQKEFNDAVKASPAEKVTIKHKDAVTATNAKLFDTAKMLRTIGTLTGGAFSVYGLRRFLSTLIEVTGQFEVQKMALRTMLQDIDAADKIFQDLYRFSSNSTYRFSELAKYSKQLAAFNIGKDSLLETTKMLGDVASGVGVSMDRIILAYGHVKSSGFLRGIQLRSFSQNGVPILDELAKMIGKVEDRTVSLGEVFDKMTKREIPFEMVEQAFKNMTSEGGRFYQMQEVLAKTLAGQINILKGRWENLMYAYGEANDGILKKLVSSVSNLIASSEEFGRFLVQLISTFGAYKVAQYIIIGLTDKMAFANLRLVKTFNALHLSNPYVAIAAGVAALTFVIIRQNKELSASEKITKALEDTTKKYDQALNSEIRELDLLYGALKSAKEGTDEYNDAKLAIEKRFDPYIQQLKSEGIEVNNLANIYDHLAERVKNASKERFLADAQSGISAAYGEAEQNAEDAFVRLLPRIKEVLGREATPDEEGALRHYIRTGGKNDLYKALASELGGAVKDVVMDINDPTGQTQRQTVTLTGQGIIDDLTKIKNDLDIASIAYTDAMKDAAKRFDAASRETSSVRPGDPRDWAKQVNSVLNTLDPEIIKKAGLGLKENEGYYEYLERVGKEYKQINEEKDKALSTDKASKELLLDAIRQVDAALEGNILSDVRYNKTPWKGSDNTDKENREKIRDLNKEASVIQKYKDVYDSLRPYLSESQTASALESLFGIKFSSTDFDTQLDRIIVKLAELGEEGQQAAESLRATLGKDTAQDLKKSLAAQDKATEMLADYLAKDFGIEGEGVAAQISKILVDLTNKNLKADKDLEKFIEELDKADIAKKLQILSENSPEFAAVRGVLGDKAMNDIVDTYWTRWRKQQIDAWKEQMKLEKQANQKMSNEQIIGKADDLFKMMTGGLDLTNWNDKTLNQLRDIKSVIASLTIPQDILDLMDEETQKRFIEAFNLLKENNTKKADKVISEKSINAAKRLASAILGIGDAFTNAGEALNNDVLTGMGKIMSVAEQVVDAIGENETLMKSITDSTDSLQDAGSDLASTADWITMIVKLVLIVINQIVDVVGQAEADTLALKQAAVDAREALFNRNMADGVESVFGSNLTRQIRNANTELDKLRANMRMMSGGATLSAMASQHALFKKSGLFNMGHTPFTLNDAAYAAGLSVIDEKYGILNKDLLEIILNNYNLEEESRIWLESALTDVENYIEAMDTLNDVMGEVFGNIAQSAAETIVDSWVEAGDAALNYADILDDVAKSYAKMLIQSAILDDVLNEDEVNRVLALFARGDRKEAMAAIAGDMEKIADMEPIFANILEAFDPYFNRDDSGSSLANGIKGITEDTANLLASYLNAIRADVAMMRLLAQQGWGSVSNIADAIGVLPTLNDYIVKIEAHNANIEANTQQILIELRGVIVNEGSGRGFRSYPA